MKFWKLEATCLEQLFFHLTIWSGPSQGSNSGSSRVVPIKRFSCVLRFLAGSWTWSTDVQIQILDPVYDGVSGVKSSWTRLTMEFLSFRSSSWTQFTMEFLLLRSRSWIRSTMNFLTLRSFSWTRSTMNFLIFRSSSWTQSTMNFLIFRSSSWTRSKREFVSFRSRFLSEQPC